MNLQTKCTWVIAGIAILELLPGPFISLYSLYAVRKRPDWLPRVTYELYNENQAIGKQGGNWRADSMLHDPMVVRRNCTIALVAIFIVDLLIPVVILTALYVVRKKPTWFINLISRLYSDKTNAPLQNPETYPINDDPTVLAKTQQKFSVLEKQNLQFAKLQTTKNRR